MKNERELIAIAGLLLLSGGTWWIYPPAACIVLGSILLGAAIWPFVTSRSKP